MIVLTKENKTIEIPNYDDLDNKPKINGVTLEGDLSSADLGIEVDTSDFYTKTQSDNRFQPKGNYLTSVPSEYATKTYVDNAIDNVEVDLTGYATEQWVENKGYLTTVPSEYVTETELNTTLTNKNYATKSEIPTIPTNISSFNNDSGYITNSALNGYATETYVSNNYQPKGEYQPAGNYLTSVPSEYITESELNEALAGLDGNGIPYAVIDGYSTSGFSITHGNWADVYSAIINKSSYVIYVRSTDQATTYSIADDISIFSSAQMISLAVTLLVANRNITYRAFNITSDGNVELSLQETYVIQQQLVSGESIKTINGNSILGSGDLTIGSSDNNGIAYLKVNYDETNGYSYDGSFTDVVDAITNNKPYIIYVPAEINPYYTTIELARVVNNAQITGASYTHTGTEHYFTSWTLLEDTTSIMKTVNERIYQNELVSGTNIKTVNGESLLGSGNIEISGGTTDLSNYYTKSEIDTQIGDINTILENIIG